jgi:hypothetical protein
VSGNGKVEAGSGANNAAFTKAALAVDAGFAADGTVTLADAATIALADEGAITVTGTTAKVILPNTGFGVDTTRRRGKLPLP